MKKIIKYPNDLLTTPTEEYDFANPHISPEQLAEELMQTMAAHNGVGLSANQIGWPYRVFAMRGEEFYYVMYNPKIVGFSDGVETLEEGCLSLPGVVCKVPRAKSVRVRFQTFSGAVETKRFDGLSARVIQHEVDHLDGVLFINRAHRYHRDKAMKGYNYAAA